MWLHFTFFKTFQTFVFGFTVWVLGLRVRFEVYRLDLGIRFKVYSKGLGLVSRFSSLRFYQPSYCTQLHTRRCALLSQQVADKYLL